MLQNMSGHAFAVGMVDIFVCPAALVQALGHAGEDLHLTYCLFRFVCAHYAGFLQLNHLRLPIPSPHIGAPHET